MTTNQKLAFAYLTMMGSVARQYAPGEMTKHGQKLQRHIVRALKKLYKHRPSEYIDLANKFAPVWEEAVKDNSGYIEGVAFITSMANKNPELMKSYGITEKLIENFSKSQGPDIDADIELHSYKLSEAVSRSVLKNLGLAMPESNGLARLKQKVRNNLIIEGKIK